MSPVLHKLPRIIFPTTVSEKARENYFVSRDSGVDSILRPTNNPAISYNNDGSVLSFYDDTIWDFTPYSSPMLNEYSKINFRNIPEGQILSVKWIIYLSIYHAPSLKENAKASRLMIIFGCLRKMAVHASEKKFNLIDLLGNQRLLNGFVRKQRRLRPLIGLISSLAKIDPVTTGFQVVPQDYIFKLRKLSKMEPYKKQYPVVPERILANFSNDLSRLFKIVDGKLQNLTSFIRELAVQDKFYAKSNSYQSAQGLPKNHHRPNFAVVVKKYGLAKLFKRFKISSVKAFSGFLTRLQDGIEIYIALYSGMRSSEIKFLKHDCLETIKLEAGNRYILHGHYIKGRDGPVKGMWVTSSLVSLPINIAVKIGEALSTFAKDNSDGRPLCVNCAILVRKNSSMTSKSTTVKSQEVFNLLDMEKYRITEEDLSSLQTIDPFRSWREEPKFKLGVVWRFNIHQLRRTLAFYVAQSGLVSLPSLRSQFKHLSSEMTLYYGQSKGIRPSVGNSVSFIEYMRAIKPEADAIAYYKEILGSDEALEGGTGRILKNRVFENGKTEPKVTIEDRAELIRRFERGEIAYHETPMGGCTTVSPCKERAMRDLSACLTCVKAIIKPSKLERVINRQERMVAKCIQNGFDDFEMRAETELLESLRDFRARTARAKYVKA